VDFKKILLNISLKDLRSSEILYCEKIYNNSLYFAQQSVEKANKSFALFNKVIDLKELKSIGHKITTIYEKSVHSDIKITNALIKLLNEYPELRETDFIKEYDFENLKQYYDKKLQVFREYNEESKPFGYNSLVSFLKKIKEIRLVKIPLTNEPISLFRNKYMDFLKFAGKVEEFHGNEKLQDELNNFLNDKSFVNSGDFKKVFGDVYNVMINIIKVNFILALYTFIFSKYGINTRHPLPDHKHDPLRVFSRKNPIIQLLPEFGYEFRLTLRRMSKLYALLEKNSKK